MTSPLRLETLVWILRATIACLAVAGMSGCATLDPPAPGRQASGLTAAAQEAKKDESDKHVSLHADRREPESVVAVVIDHDDGDACRHGESEPAAAPGPKTPRPPLHLGLIAGGGSASGGQFQEHGLAGIQFGVEPAPRTRIDVSLMAVPQRFAVTPSPLGGLDRPFEVAADVSARYYLTPDGTAQSVYPIAGIRFGSLGWSYHHTIFVDGEPIPSDALEYVAPYGGIGAALLRTRGFELGANLTGGWRLYDDHAASGLRNDLFRDAGFVQLTFETTFRF